MIYLLLLLLLFFALSSRRRTIVYVPVDSERSLGEELFSIFMLFLLGGFLLWWLSP